MGCFEDLEDVIMTDFFLRVYASNGEHELEFWNMRSRA